MMFLSDENRKILYKRLTSLAWRIGMMVLAVLVDFAVTNLELFDIPPQYVVLLGLILGEVSKQLNKKSYQK